MRPLGVYLVLIIFAGMSGCKTDSPKPLSEQTTPTSVAPEVSTPSTQALPQAAPAITGAAAPLSTDEYQKLAPEQQYQVANKLMATLYKGVPVNDFFDLSKGLATPVVSSQGNDFIAATGRQLATPLTDKAPYIEATETRHIFDVQRRSMEYPLAMMHEFPLSKDHFTRWMAYKLANTILFSPALEVPSVSYSDIQGVYYRLVYMLENGASIRDIVYAHMISQENWRRFTSPEDNTREMMEVYLGRFIDEEVPKASIACKNWSLTDAAAGYQRVISFNENTTPQTLLETTVTSCYDFYRAVADHAMLIPRVTVVLVDTFFSDATTQLKSEVINSILAQNPTTFEQIFKLIIFSKSYLMQTSRAKGLEEVLFNVGARIQWRPANRFFNALHNPTPSSTTPTLKQLGQESMVYKLGRMGDIPLDGLSFSYYHKLLREKLMLDRKINLTDPADGGWQPTFVDITLTDDDFIQYVFLSVLSRKANTQELSTLRDLIKARNYQTKKTEKALVILDYLSRLAELYAFEPIS